MWSERRSKLVQLSMTVAPPSLSGKSPIDDKFAERTSLRLHVPVTIAGDIAPSATVEDLSSSARVPNLCRFPVKPSGGFHIKLLLESGRERILCEVERLKPDSSRQNANLCWLQKLIYISSILESFVKQFYENCSKMYY